MGLVVNHNLMAMTAARNLGVIYGRLAVSTARLSSGLRINSAADDAAGLAVRESMRADIAVLNQGVRNAGDAISLIQTAEGALSVVDEKLIRMKELAEQAATGTYTTAQRTIMDSEYQAMAAEIDRIANATDFNGVKLLDGSITVTNSSGLKIHFGTGNLSAEDYYYINIGDMRATETTGLQVGGGATVEILTASTGFATAGSTSIGVGHFAFYYDQSADQSGTLSKTTAEIGDLAGFYAVVSGANYLNTLVNQINQGTAARIFAGMQSGVSLTTADVIFTINGVDLIALSTAASIITANAAGNIGISTGNISGLSQDAMQGNIIAAINNAAVDTGVWAISGDSGGQIMFIAKHAGLTGNTLSAKNGVSGVLFTTAGGSAIASCTATFLSGGGQTWATASAYETNNTYYLRLAGATAGDNYDIGIADPNSLLSLTNIGTWTNATADFNETQDATGTGGWNGADILTQSAAQLALDQIGTAIDSKDNTRASLGSLSNRLENTITNLTVQAENLQAAESRVSDVDVALEMTEFTKNNILVQAAVAMLAQANTLPTLALTLLGGV